MNVNRPLLSPEGRTAILDREIAALVAVGLQLVSRINHYIAVLDQEDDAERVEVYVDPHGLVALI